MPVSVFTVGTLLLRSRWRIARWALAGGLIALALVWNRPALYRASTAFIPQGADPARSGLASLAGQFGVAMPAGGGQSLSPDFYLRLLKSREMLGQLARDTVVVPELGARRVAVEDLLEIPAGTPKQREEAAIEILSRRITAGSNKATAVVEFGVGMEWPSVSLGMVNTMLQSVNEFNQRTRRDQAASERKFLENRLAVATTELRAAEDRLQGFLQGNRSYESPDLQFQRQRLERDVALRQQVFTSITQSFEEVRMREVRDTPSITIVDQPDVPTKPEPRGRGARILAGVMLGALGCALFVVARDAMAKRRAEGDPAADEFVSAVSEIKGHIVGRVRRIGRRASA